jgi:hypothetical protein
MVNHPAGLSGQFDCPERTNLNVYQRDRDYLRRRGGGCMSQGLRVVIHEARVLRHDLAGELTVMLLTADELERTGSLRHARTIREAVGRVRRKIEDSRRASECGRGFLP